MDVSVIVTCYNNAHNLSKCIDSLLAQNDSPLLASFEIIVVDSGSTDSSQTILRNYGKTIRVILAPPSASKPLSAPEARNLGVKEARGTVLIFTDSDCTASYQLVTKMLWYYNNSSVTAVMGSREPDEGVGFGTFIRRYEFILYSNKYTIKKPILMKPASLQGIGMLVLLASNNFSMKREAWMSIGGMDTAPGEDILLQIDILRRGGDILFDPAIMVSHRHSFSFIHLLQRSWRNGLSTYLAERRSDGLINWRHFQKRGRNFNIHTFIGAALLIIISGIACLMLGADWQFLAVGSLLALSCFLRQLIRTRMQLTRILEAKGTGALKKYQLSLLGIGLFVTAHFLVKFIASACIVYTTLSRPRKAYSDLS